MSHAETDLASTIVVVSQLQSLIFLGVRSEMCPDSENWSWKRREEGCSLVEQHCHLMVRVHPYKVCSNAPIRSVQGRELQAHVSPAAENPGEYANFTSLLPALELEGLYRDQSQDRVFGRPSASSRRSRFPHDNPAAASEPAPAPFASEFFC